jgi:hypothetical protein
VPIVRRWGATLPILGVCLGHQAIGEAYGGAVVRAGRIMHGKTSPILHDGAGLFAGLPSPLNVMRYHSLVVEHASMPAELEVTAVAADDPTEVHAVKHRTHRVWGVQFHPESILTDGGKAMLGNVLELARGARAAARAPPAGSRRAARPPRRTRRPSSATSARARAGGSCGLRSRGRTPSCSRPDRASSCAATRRTRRPSWCSAARPTWPARWRAT